MRERLGWAAALVAAALTGFWFGRGDSPELVTPAVSAATPGTGDVSGVMREPPGDSRTTVAEPKAGNPPPAEKRLSASQQARLDEHRRASEDIVANALALGRWSDSDASALAVASQSLPIHEQHALQLRVARALNEDRLKFEAPAPPVGAATQD